MALASLAWTGRPSSRMSAFTHRQVDEATRRAVTDRWNSGQPWLPAHDVCPPAVLPVGTHFVACRVTSPTRRRAAESSAIDGVEHIVLGYFDAPRRRPTSAKGCADFHARPHSCPGAARHAPGNELCTVVAIAQGMNHALQDPERA